MDDDGASTETRENLVAFGAHLRQLRTARRLSQEQLAHDAGLHRAVVGFIERGERDVGVSHVWPLARALGVDPGELFPPAGASSVAE